VQVELITRLGIHAAAGMYTRWAENHDYEVEVLDYQPGDEAGVKNVTLLIKGMNSYGYLKSMRKVSIAWFEYRHLMHLEAPYFRFLLLRFIPEIEDEY